MRALKVIGIILGSLVALVLVLSLVAPKEMSVERSTIIEASPSEVYPYISSFEQSNRWQPWMQLDPNMKSGIKSTDGEVGSTYWWEGNDDVGKGEQTITAMTPNKSVEVDLKFMEPWESQADAYTQLEEVDNGTKVTWGFDSPMPFPANIMGLFMNMTDALEEDYDKGLANLKELVENEKSNHTMTYDIKTVDFPAMQVVEYRKEIGFDEIATFIQTEMPKIGMTVAEKKIEMAGQPMNLTYVWDEENQRTETSVAIPVSGKHNLGEKYSFLEIPSSKALVIDYYGDYEGTIAAHEVMDKHLKAKNLTIKMPVIEQYVTDPGEEPDPSKWLTKIYYLLEG